MRNTKITKKNLIKFICASLILNALLIMTGLFWIVRYSFSPVTICNKWYKINRGSYNWFRFNQ